MATSYQFITEMAKFYIDALRSGLPYNFAYDISLANAARTYQFSCAPLTQELKLQLLINPNGCTNTIESQSGLGGYQGQGNLPVEISRMITIMGIDATQQRLTELFVSCLDGTFVQNGFDETVINSIIQKFLSYIQKGCLTTRLICDCNDSSKDPCRVITSISTGRNVRYDTSSNFAEIDEQLTNRIQNLLSNKIGKNFEIENLTVGEINQIEQTFIDVLNILYSNNRTTIDPNSGASAAIIRDFFDQARQFNRTTQTRGFSGTDFIVLLALINSNGQFPRISSLYSRVVSQIGNIFRPLINVRVQPGSFEARPDYSTNSIMFSSILEFETKNVDCKPEDYPYLGDDSKIQQICECPPPQNPKVCRTSFLANVVPNPIIYEVPFFYASGKAIAELPTPPDVQFIPYKDVDSTILINLNTMAGRYTTKFVPITGKDQEYISSLASSRGVAVDSLFDFEGDPDVQYYEAFRIDKHPMSYEDFQQATVFKFVNYREGLNRSRNVSVFRDIDIRAYSNGISQEHNIAPNKKYYYIFRTVDVNSNISNPSKVFELEMINNGGAIFPVIRVVDFAKPPATNDKVEMRRLLMMSPTRQQTDIYASTLELVENYGIRTAREAIRSLKLSTNVENPIWDKKFKIRFTSLDTGRMLDINVVPTIEIIDPVEKCGPSPGTLDAVGQALDTFYGEVTTRMDTPI